MSFPGDLRNTAKVTERKAIRNWRSVDLEKYVELQIGKENNLRRQKWHCKTFWQVTDKSWRD